MLGEKPLRTHHVIFIGGGLTHKISQTVSHYMGDYLDRWPLRYTVAADLGMKARPIGTFNNDQVQNVAFTQIEPCVLGCLHC